MIPTVTIPAIDLRPGMILVHNNELRPVATITREDTYWQGKDTLCAHIETGDPLRQVTSYINPNTEVVVQAATFEF